jgi:uncharacterized coiled-coil protein SlyX
VAEGNNVLAIGPGAVAKGWNTNVVSIGTNSYGDGTNVISIGTNAQANGVNASAFGAGAIATATNSLALGGAAAAVTYGSTALGQGATTNRLNQVAIGTQINQYQLPGLAPGGQYIGTTYQNTQAQLGNGRFVTTDSLGTLGTTSFSINQLLSSIQGVAASTAALSALPTTTLGPDETMRCGFGSGAYGNNGAGAFGCAAKINEAFYLNFGGALAGPSYFNGSVVGKVGFSFPIGRSAKTKKDEENKLDQQLDQLNALTQEISKLKNQIKAMEAESVAASRPLASAGHHSQASSYQSLLDQLKRAKQTEADLIATIAKSQERLNQQQETINQQAKQIAEHKQILVAQQKQIDLLLQRLGISPAKP